MAALQGARRHPRNRTLFLLACGLVLFTIVLLAPLFTARSPNLTDLSMQLSPPSSAHPLGTDFYGRDIVSRLLHGGRATLAVAAAAIAFAVIVGGIAGLLAGSMQGWAGQVWVGAFDLMLAFPTLLLALLVVAVLGPGLPALAVAVGVASIPGYGRLVRALTLSLQSAAFVDAARAVGAGPFRILTHHILRNIVRPVLALATLDLGRAIISVAALGYLGLGAAPPQAEWGLMLYEGRGYIASAPWASFVPGLAITVTVLIVTFLGDALVE